MDFRVLMLQAIALLFWESRLSANKLPESQDLIIDLINDLPPPENQAGTDEDRENLASLRSIASSLAGTTSIIDRDSLLHRVKIGIKKDPELRDDINEMLSGDEYNLEEINEKIVRIRTEIKEYFTVKKFKDEVKKLTQLALYNPNHFNVSKVANDFIERMEQYTVGVGNEEDDPALNGYGDIDNMEQMIEAFTNVQEDLNPESILKTGWQALNRMFGEVGGIRRGNMYVFGAMPSKGKSLVSMNITTHIPMYNIPFMEDHSKKPLIVHFSTENDIPLNLKIMYRSLWEHEHQEPCDIASTSPEYMAKYFKETIGRNGYHFKFYHIDPTLTGYHAITDRLKRLEAEGYEIHLVTIDYLAMLNNDGLGDENRAFWVRQLFKVIRNYCNPRKIAAITPHQVSTDASMFLRQGTDDFVKSIAGKRYWADCRSIDMEVDCEVVLNIETGTDGKSYMAFGRGKDRSSAGTPEKDKFFFIPFSQYGGLRPDIEGQDSSKRTIRGNTDVTIADDWMSTHEF